MAWLEIFVSSTGYKVSSIILYSVLALLVGYISYLFLQWQRKVRIINRIPGPKTVPLFGNALELNTGSAEFFQLFFIKYCQLGKDGLYRMWIGPIPAVAIYNADAVEKILRGNKYLEKSPEYGLLHSWLGTGLLTSMGNKWQRHRKILTPSFHFKILEDFIDVMNHQSSKLITKLSSKADGNSFDIFPLISLCTLDIIIETAMGTNMNAQDDSQSEYVKAVHDAGDHFVKRFIKPWLRSDIGYRLSGYAKEYDRCLKVLHNLSMKTVKDRKKEYLRLKSLKKEEKGKEEEVFGKRKKLAFLDMLIEHSEGGEVLSDEEIRMEVDTFMFEGHDTTSAGVNWSIYLLGSHKEFQEKVFEELDSIFGDSDRPATPDDLREMKYLECCIKEALRIFPSAPFIGRTLEEDVELNGYTVPKGTGIDILIYSLHRDPKYFPNPEEYNPERFFPENVVKRHPYAYVPFSAGPRNCIGQKFAQMEEKIILSSFFRKYKVESMQKREDLILLPDMIIRPEDGIFVKLLPRK